MRNKDDIFWDMEDAEILVYNDKNEAIEMILDGESPSLPEKITICGYRREKVKNFLDADQILEEALERLNERYGSPDGEDPETTEEMEKAAKEFIEKIESEYVPWTCEIFTKEEIDVKKWVQENAPNWLEEGINFEGWKVFNKKRDEFKDCIDKICEENRELSNNILDIKGKLIKLCYKIENPKIEDELLKIVSEISCCLNLAESNYRTYQVSEALKDWNPKDSQS